MLITNKSDLEVECIVDSRVLYIRKNETVKVFNSSKLEIKHIETSFVCDEVRKSRLLKVLGFFDDPFKTKKEYNICVDSSFNLSNCADDDKLTIQRQSVFADTDLLVFYDYFVLCNDNNPMMPDSVTISDDNDICRLFAKYNKVNVRWNAIYNIFVEPIIFEIVGYMAVYWLLSLMIGNKALWIIGIVLVINVLVETIMFVLKDKHSDTDSFGSLLNVSDIINCCYGTTN